MHRLGRFAMVGCLLAVCALGALSSFTVRNALAGPGGAVSHDFKFPKATPQQAKLPRWEYFCFNAFGTSDLETKSNQMGAEAWEMVSSTPGSACFKRQKL